MNVPAFLLGRGNIGRTAYLCSGITLMLLKYNLDRWLTHGFGFEGWSLAQPEVWRIYLLQVLPRREPTADFAFLLATSLPFLWLGVMLTLARLRSAGLRTEWALLFFVPVIKLAFFAVLSALPEREVPEAETSPLSGRRSQFDWLFPKGPWACAFTAAFYTGLLGVGLTAFSTGVLRDYGWALFVATPFMLGLFASLLYGWRQSMSIGKAVQVALMANAVTGLLLLALAVEGALCLAMASPIAAVLGTLGGLVGYRVIATAHPDQAPPMLSVALLAMPMLMMGEHLTKPEPPLLRVTSAIIVDAPPERVWQHVVTFGDLPPPTDWMFHTGMAYPLRAEIEGRGVGAIRYCQFSTGPFVEPITVWDEPRLLRFSVTANPPSMEEWSPYRHIHPPHIDGFLVSRQGQFRLEPMADGKTLLEGTTWYHHNLWPVTYWQLWSDFIIHKIHLRVLRHVKMLVESETQKGSEVAP